MIDYNEYILFSKLLILNKMVLIQHAFKKKQIDTSKINLFTQKSRIRQIKSNIVKT